MQLLARLAVEHAHDAVQTHRSEARERGVNRDVPHTTRVALVHARHAKRAQVHTTYATRRVAHVQGRIVVRHAAARKGTIADLYA